MLLMCVQNRNRDLDLSFGFVFMCVCVCVNAYASLFSSFSFAQSILDDISLLLLSFPLLIFLAERSCRQYVHFIRC